MSINRKDIVNFLSGKFKNIIEMDRDKILLNIKEAVKYICSGEYTFISIYNNIDNSLRVIDIENEITIKVLDNSIISAILASNQPFFDNYIASHKNYNQKIDNPFNIRVKSLAIIPIFDKNKIVAFLSILNSVNSNRELKRHDIHYLKLLSPYISKSISKFNISNQTKTQKEKTKEIIVPNRKKEPIKNIKRRATRLELEAKISKLEETISQKDKDISTLYQKNSELTIEIDNLNSKIEDLKESEKRVSKKIELKNILDFLNGEIVFFSNQQHNIYLLLEIIKHSLGDNRELDYIDTILKKKNITSELLDNIYNYENIKIENIEFNIFEEISSLVYIYYRSFSSQNITFNIFLDPNSPRVLILDMEKIKSCIIHLINNTFSLTEEGGAVELLIRHSSEEELLYIDIRGIKPHKKRKKIYNFFKKEHIEHSIISDSAGVGLGVCSNIINKLGGKLQLKRFDDYTQSFIAQIPILDIRQDSYITKSSDLEDFKIAVLMSENNSYAYKNISRYLEEFGINSSNIFHIHNINREEYNDFTHLICFDNMLSNNVDIPFFPNIIIFKYSENSIKSTLKANQIDEIYVNSYYGLELENIFFPNIEHNPSPNKSILSKLSNLIMFKNS